jgi:plasmid stabilization system protein ParE
MKLRFTLEALNHIAAIHFYIQAKNARAAAHIVDRVFADCDRLSEFPEIGHIGTAPGTFEWTVAGLPYIIVYQLDSKKNEVIVLGVFHGAQDRLR